MTGARPWSTPRASAGGRERRQPVEVGEAGAQRGAGSECVGPGHGVILLGGSGDEGAPSDRSLHSLRGSVPRARPGRQPARPDEGVGRDRRPAPTRGRAPRRRRTRRRCATSTPRASRSTRRRPASIATATTTIRATTSTRTCTAPRASGRSSASSARVPSGWRSAIALDRAGWPVGAVASRDPGRRQRFRDRVTGARGFAEANALVDDVELVILAVPDDAVVAVAESHPAVRGPGAGPHERRAGCGRARAGARGRDAGRRVPPARGLRRPRSRPRRAARRDGRHRGRRRAGGAPGGDGGVDRRRSRPPARRVEGGLPRGGGARGGRGRCAARHDPRDRRPARARRGGGDGRSTCRSSSRRWATPGRSASPGR